MMYFQAKTGIFASCVIYCGSHLHIKALISPSERVCVCVAVVGGAAESLRCVVRGGVHHFESVWIGARGERSDFLSRPGGVWRERNVKLSDEWDSTRLLVLFNHLQTTRCDLWHHPKRGCLFTFSQSGGGAHVHSSHWYSHVSINL